MMTDDELAILSFYRSSELAGAILLGRLALVTEHDRIRVPLTEQCAEEARHGWIFTKVIADLGRTPQRTTETYQSVAARTFGMPRDVVDILCLTRLLEVEALAQYRRHVTRAGLHPIVREALATVIEDEVGHVGWIDEELAACASEVGRETVDRAVRRAEDATRAAFAELRAHPVARAYFGGGAEAHA
jgi:hypothetical protein